MSISIFYVFLALSNTSPIIRSIATKVANYIRLPYVKDRINFSETKMKTYGGIYNLIHGMENEDFITYFQMKNSVIRYYRKLPNASQFFWFKSNLTGYELIDFVNVKYNIRDSENLLIKTSGGKWYIISDGVECDGKKNCLALIDATTGRSLFLDSKDNNLLIKFLYPLADAILPILQVKKREISFHLFDLSSNEVKVISWDVPGSIRNLILLLSNKKFYRILAKDIENDTIDLFLQECKLKYDYYDLMNSKIANGIGRIVIGLDLTLLGSKYKYVIENLNIKMSIKEGKHDYFSLNLTLDVEGTTVYFFKSKSSKKSFAHSMFFEYFEDLSKINFLSVEHPINKTSIIERIYMGNTIYKDECRYIVWNNAGIRIFDKDDFVGEEFIKAGDSRIIVHGCALMYTYGKYVIIVTDVGYDDVKLIVLYPKNESIGMWKIKDESWDCTDNKGIYNYHYDALYNRLVFLSQDLQCLFFIEIEKMGKILKSIGKTGCKSKSYRNISELGKAFNLKKLIAEAINEYHKPPRGLGKTKNQSNKKRISFLGYYMDKDLNKLYIAAKYSLYGLEYIGLFVSRIGKQMEFRLLSSVLNGSTYSLYYDKGKLQAAKVRGLAPFLNWFLYDFPKRTVGTLGLYYNKNNKFIDINYNRQSNKLLEQGNKHDLEKALSYNIGNLLVIMSECRELSKETLMYLSDLKLRFYCDKAYGFVISSLNLVKRMSITVIQDAHS